MPTLPLAKTFRASSAKAVPCASSMLRKHMHGRASKIKLVFCGSQVYMKFLQNFQHNCHQDQVLTDYAQTNPT